MRWDLEYLLRSIEDRLNRPEAIPSGSYYSAYREDIRVLLLLIKEIQDERRKDNRKD